MKNKRNQRGFTLAELLIVVAIIGVLAGVSFVAVQTYQKGLNQVELDTVAKEIFVAAQNHLSMAWNEGYLGLTDADFGTLGTKATPAGQSDEYFDTTPAAEGETGVSRGVYYFSVEDGIIDTDIQSIHALILPPYALDGDVAAGNYLIRYQPSTGLVLDVFYTARTGRYAKPLPEYSDLMDLRWDDKKSERRSQDVGWYGGTEAASLPQGETLEAPELEVENGDRLVAWIKDNNKSATQYTVALLVTGKISRAQQVFKVLESQPTGAEPPQDGGADPEAGSGDPEESTTVNRIDLDVVEDVNRADMHSVVLDSITEQGLHFAEITSAISGVDFIPGEDIVLRAVAYNMNAISNIANSDEKTVNSLFEMADNADEKTLPWSPITAYINNFRHLENLDKSISGVNYSPATAGPNVVAAEGIKPLSVKAVQTTDLEWKADGDVFNDETIIYKETGGPGEKGCFVPIVVPATYTVSDASISIAYHGVEMPDDGEDEEDDTLPKPSPHSIKGITVNVTGAASAGLFGDLPNDSSVKDLALIDFTVTSVSGSAGALAGTLKQSAAMEDGSVNVSNVVAYNTGKAATATITSSGDVGGLIGKVTGDKAVVEKSAAALVVSSTGGNAGGLIGTMEGGTVTACYSGGHTKDGGYYDGATAIYNVTATAGKAGGLIGNAGNTAVSNSYSTCSATGNQAGGLVGNAAGAISACYSTGLVSGSGTDPVAGAFAVLADGASATDCTYYQTINELATVKRGTDEMTVQMAEVATSDVIQSIQYMPPAMEIKNDGTAAVSGIDIEAIDESADSYNTFVGAPETWTKAMPYDSKLLEYYSVKNSYPDVDESGNPITKEVMESSFNLKGINRLVSTPDEAAYVAIHYGDWPAPEIFVVNKAS